MPTGTRSSVRRDTLMYVIKDILKAPDDSPIIKATDHHGIQSMNDLLALSEHDIMSLTYTEGNNTHALALQHRSLLRILKAWNYYLMATLGIKRVEWDDTAVVNADDFDDFRITEYDPDQPVRKISPIPNHGPTTPGSASSASTHKSMYGSLSYDFKKGIKRDKTHYSELRDERYWDDWKRKTVATVHAHGCENIINPTYVPTNQDEVILFRDQQNFMYDVFLSVIKTHMGKFYVRNHENARDAQSVWKEYSNYMKTSTRADIRIEELMSTLTSLRLDSSQHKGSTQSFVTRWLDQLRQYEDLTPASAHFPDVMKKAMLQNALNGVQTFRDVKNTEQLEVAKGRGAIGYQEYVSLIQKVAANFDNDVNQRTNRVQPVRLQGNNHTLTEPAGTSENVFAAHFNEFDYYESTMDLDDPIDDHFGSLSVNANRLRASTRRPSLRRDIWQQLSRNDQMAWDQVSDVGKRAIIFGCQGFKPRGQDQPRGVTADTNRSNEVGTSNPTPTAPPRTVNNATSSSPDQAASSTSGSEQSSSPSFDIVETPDLLIQAARQGTPVPPSDIRRLLSPSTPNAPSANTPPPSMTTGTQVTNHETHYRVSSSNATSHDGALVDRGANGGLAGHDVRVISKTDRQVDISGIDNHQITGLPIVTAGGITESQRGPILVILHQYAHVPQGRTIHSSIQMESFGTQVDDRSSRITNGKQAVLTHDGYTIPLSFRNGLPYMPMRPFTDTEWDTLPHVVLTSDATDWDPSLADFTPDVEALPPALQNDDPPLIHHPFDHIGDHPRRITRANWFQVVPTCDTEFVSQNHTVTSRPRDFDRFRPYFLGVSAATVAKTFDSTTQYARSGWITGDIHQTHKAPFPALNIPRRNEGVATDTVFSDTPAVDDGSVAGQFFSGMDSRFCATHGCHTDAEFARTLMDEIRKRGVMDLLISDRAEAEISTKVKDILRHLFIDDWQSEPHYHHQNPAERRFQNVKANTNRVLDSTGAPANTWLLCMQYVCFIMNRTALESLHWRTPYECLHGSTPDISMVYRFKFWDPVYFQLDDTRHFPSDTTEAFGHFVGFSESVGHVMTYIVLHAATQKILYRSRLRLATIRPNLRLDATPPDPADIPLFLPGPNDVVFPPVDQPPPPGAQDPSSDLDDNNPSDAPAHAPPSPTPPPEPPDPPAPPSPNDHVRSPQRPMATLNPDDLLGRSFLSHPSEDGLRSRLYVLEALDALQQATFHHPSHLRFRCSNNDDTVEEILTYNQLLDRLESPDGTNDEWHFHSITDHQGPLSSSDPDYKGSSWNLRVNWEDGSSTMEPLGILMKSDPVTCAIYGRDNNLLHLPGWKRLARLARRHRKLLRMANQAKLQSFRHAPVFMFGVQVPRNHRHAMDLDAHNGNHLWRDAEERELAQIDEYSTFRDCGHHHHSPPPSGHKRIQVHMVYAVKFDGRHKARLVAGGHLTDTPVESVYSSVVSLRGLRLTILLGELTRQHIWNTDIGNAYLEAFTDEKLYIIAGEEFGSRKGHILVISRALYGLRSSGLRWWERFSEVLVKMGFFPSKAEDDIWMRRVDDHYEYIARYVDDLAIVSETPQKIIDSLEKEHGFKLKGTGPIDYHLGADFFRDDDGTLCMAPRKYIERVIESYARMFGTKPTHSVTSPLEKNDHPELDTSEELDVRGTKQYQSLIGSLQWAVSLGRFDIATAVMTMSRFRAAPRKGHLERVKRIVCYLSKMKHGTIRFRTGLPDYSDIPKQDYGWDRTVYGNVREEIPSDAPEPLGPPVIHTVYVDANLLHDLTTGRSVTGVLHFVNKTPIDWYTKRQGTVETATYGSEIVAARTMTEQSLDLRTTLRYLGVNVSGPTFAFGDNKTVVDNVSTPKGKLHKRHVILSFHRIREAIAAGVLRFFHMPGSENPSDVLSKAWGYQQVWSLIQAILFWKGDTMELVDKKSKS